MSFKLFTVYHPLLSTSLSTSEQLIIAEPEVQRREIVSFPLGKVYLAKPLFLLELLLSGTSPP